ncbi:MAG TPA: hypothetical protein PK467_15185 [Candidatus Wallbacteria bacterium]|nr:hypothetical protein [Candidatus Wallbacteria bacterium]
MSFAQDLKSRYRSASESLEAMKTSDKLIIALTVLLVIPFIFFYFIYPAQALQIKRLGSDLKSSRLRFANLSENAERVEKKAAEARGAEAELNKKISSLVYSADSGAQFIDFLSNAGLKSGLDMKIIKKRAKYDEIYEKTHIFREEGLSDDDAPRFSYKLLPLEITFRSSSADMMAFFNIMEGYKNVNFFTRSVNAVRTDDGNCEVNLVLEIIIELKLI